jgi:uncharacterized membrane protein YhhN
VTVAGPVILCLLAVTGLLIAEHRGSQRGLWLTKPVASAAFIWLGLASGSLGSTYGMLVLAGLALCMLGDVLLIPRDRPGIFWAGVFAFLLGHVAYSAAFLTQPLSVAGLVTGGVLLAAVVWTVLRWLARTVPVDMVVPVRAYMVVIGVMSTLACGVSVAGGPWQVAIGALAFTASDVSVARDRFVKHEFLNRAWGLPLYFAAQLLIAVTPAFVR